MGKQHIVKQGEHASSIAAQYGFRDFNSIWGDAQNKALRDKRKNPHVLFPGDVVFIPDRLRKDLDRPTAKTHSFTLKARPLHLRIILERQRGEPFANTPCKLAAGDEGKTQNSKADGSVERDIGKSETDGALEIESQISLNKETIPLDIVVPVHIGHLDPVDTPSGQLSRLANLGYYRGVEDPVDNDELHSAIEEFQCDNPPLKVTGILDAATQAKLEAVHGC